MKPNSFAARVIYKNSPQKGEYLTTLGFTKRLDCALHLSKEEWALWFEDMDRRVKREVPLSKIVKLVPLR